MEILYNFRIPRFIWKILRDFALILKRVKEKLLHSQTYLFSQERPTDSWNKAEWKPWILITGSVGPLTN